MHTSTFPLTSVLDEGWLSTPRLGRFTTGNDPVPIVQEVGWAPGSIWTAVGNLAPHNGIRSLDSPARSEFFNDFFKFFIRCSVHRNSRLKKSNEMQQYADIYLLLNYSTCFGRPSRPSSGVHKTVVAASGTDQK